MKNVCFVLCLFMTLLCFAKPAKIHQNPTVETSAYSYAGGVFTIKKSGDLTLKYYSPASKYGQVTDFGYYFTDNPNKRISIDSHLTGNEVVAIENLKKGDMIGLYFETKKNTTGTVYTEAKLNQDGHELFFFETDNKADFFTFGDSKWGDGQVLAFQAEMSGQPLPGVIATLVLGGAGIGAFIRKKKKEQKA